MMIPTFLDLRFENERLAVLVECKNKFSRWDKAKIQGQLQDYVRFEKAYSDKKIVAILAETDGDEVWVWYGQSVIIDDEHRIGEETTIRTFEEYENLCFGRVNDKIKVVDSIKTLNEKLHSDGINEKLRSQFVGTCLLALKNGLVYKNVKETLDPKTGKKLAPERVVLKNIKDILEGLLTRGGITSATDAEKTLGKCHIEYQTLENGICGRSLEEAIMNVNRSHYGLAEPVAEEDLEFTEKSKTDFALNLICNNPNYSIPQYIKNGLIWLNKQRVLE